MGAFKSAIITKKGQALLSKLITGKVTKIDFTKIAVSENALSGDLTTKTGIGTIKQDVKVASVIVQNNASVKVSGSFSNAELTAGYYVRNIGLYAIDPQEGEILYSISVADESVATADWMPPYNGVGVSSLMIDLVTVVANASEVDILVDPTAVATVAQIINLQDQINAMEPSKEASGDTVILKDSANLPFIGMGVYGKSTQAGEPTLDTPVNVVPIGDSGAVNVDVFGKNIIGTPKPASTNSYGITFESINNVAKGYEVKVKGTSTAPEGTSDACCYFMSSAKSLGIFVKGGEYIVSFDKETSGVFIMVNYSVDGKTWVQKPLANTSRNQRFTIPNDATGIRIMMYVTAGTTVNTTVDPMIRYADIEDETWESFNQQSVKLNTANGLHGIPVERDGNYTDKNGHQWICDEIDLERGVYIQRVGKAVLDGTHSDNIVLRDTYGEALRFDLKYITTKPQMGVGICSHLPLGVIGAENAEMFNIHGETGYPIIQILSSRLMSADVAGLTAYLTDNPITIYYALAKPVETALTSKELTAYKSLKTSHPTTTIVAEGAHLFVEYFTGNYNKAFNEIVNICEKIQIGSYTGTGSCFGKDGDTAKNQISFNFAPKIIFIKGENSASGETWFTPQDKEFSVYGGEGVYANMVAWNSSNNTVTWYCADSTNSRHQLNGTLEKYNFIAIG